MVIFVMGLRWRPNRWQSSTAQGGSWTVVAAAIAGVLGLHPWPLPPWLELAAIPS